MPNHATVETIDSIKPVAFSTATEYARRLPNVRYCDIRVEVDECFGLAADPGRKRLIPVPGLLK